MRSVKTRYSGRIVLTISEEMSVKRLVRPRLTTFRLTRHPEARPDGWSVWLGRLSRSWVYTVRGRQECPAAGVRAAMGNSRSDRDRRPERGSLSRACRSHACPHLGGHPPERRLPSHASLFGLDKRRGRGRSEAANVQVVHATTHPPGPLRRAADPRPHGRTLAPNDPWAWDK